VSKWAGGDPSRLEQAIVMASKLGGSKSLDFLDSVAHRDDVPEWISSLANRKLHLFRGRGGHEKTDDDHADHGEELRNDPLIRALSDADREVRVGAMAVIVSQRRTDAIEPLCELLDHEDAETAEAAFGALVELEHPRAVPCLVRWSSSVEQRLIPLIEALAVIGGPESIEVLEVIAREHRSAYIKSLAQSALGRARAER
jgi:hypothetical protein